MSDLTSQVAGVTTTLLCGPSLGSETRTRCPELLTAAAAEGREVLWVTYTRPPPACVRSVPDDVPVRGVIAVGDAPNWETSLEDVDVEVVATPGDITALGIKLSRFLSGADDDLVVCFDSVTAMCQYVESDTAYGFLHAIAVQLYEADATAHFHLDPVAHDEAAVDLFTSLCDAVVDTSGDDPVVRTRPH